MCSISWQFHPEGYDLFFTRDEQRSRPTAAAPRMNKTVEGASYLAPTDPQGGGTWIFVNEHGLTGALLNAYELTSRTPTAEAPRSRGRLLASLAATTTVETFGRDLAKRIALHPYAPCYLFAMAPVGGVGCWLWDGHALSARPIPESPFFTTSSVRSAEVCAHRSERFQHELGQPPYSPATLERFHRDTDSRLSAFDIRMSRPDARSVSLTHIACDHAACIMHYAARHGDGPFAAGLETKLVKKNCFSRVFET